MTKKELHTARKKKIIEVSDEVLLYLLEYREQNSGFVFNLRQRDFVNSNEIRFANGYWFQGSDYIWISAYVKGDNNNKTKSIGFVIEFDENNQLQFSKQLAFGGDNNADQINFYKDIAKLWKGGAYNKGTVKYKKSYTGLTLKESLFEFFIEDKALIDNLIGQYGIATKS